MSITATKTMGSLIDEVLDYLQMPSEHPFVTTLGGNALSTTSDTQFTLADATAVEPPMIIEIANEIILVTAKSDDSTPVLTGSRGYLGTPLDVHAAGAVVRVAPVWTRYRVQRAIEQAMAGPFNTHLPNRSWSTVTFPDVPVNYVEVPATTLRVVSVSYIDGQDALQDLHGWRHRRGHPASTTDQVLEFTHVPTSVDECYVERVIPWAWSDATPDEDSTIDLPVGATDLPALYTAARLVMGREISRQDLDKVEEWNKDEVIRAGLTLRLARELWLDFYRRLTEVRDVHPEPKHRPYMTMPRLPTDFRIT